MELNKQIPVKADRQDNGSLLVHSIFLTLQGEGPHTGEPAIFVRLGGCNLQCPQCDTEYTGDQVRRWIFNDLVNEIEETHRWKCLGNPLVVITGGEPLRQNIIPLINWLVKHRYRVQLETNGTLGIDKQALSDDTRYALEIVVSPKAGKVAESLHAFIIAYKYVINYGQISDDGFPETILGLPGKPARPHAGYHKKVYLQPADENDPTINQLNLKAAIHACTLYGHTLCLQIHKLIGLP